MRLKPILTGHLPLGGLESRPDVLSIADHIQDIPKANNTKSVHDVLKEKYQSLANITDEEVLITGDQLEKSGKVIYDPNVANSKELLESHFLFHCLKDPARNN